MELLKKRMFAVKDNNEVVGLDIGTSSVKMIHLGRDDGRYFVKAAAISELTDGFSTPERSESVSAVRKCLAVTSLETRYAVSTTGLPARY